MVAEQLMYGDDTPAKKVGQASRLQRNEGFALEAIHQETDPVTKNKQKIVRLRPPPNPRIMKAILEGDGLSRMLTDWEIENLRREDEEDHWKLKEYFRKKAPEDPGEGTPR